MLSAVYNTSEDELNRGAHKGFITRSTDRKNEKRVERCLEFKTIGSKLNTDQEYLALTKRFKTRANEIDTYTWFITVR